MNILSTDSILLYPRNYWEAPIYFSNIFISFLGLAYFTPLGWDEKGQSAKKNLNRSNHPKGVK